MHQQRNAFSRAENRVTAAAEALVTTAGAAAVAAARVWATALGIGSDTLLLTAWAIYLSQSLWLSCLLPVLCALCSVAQKYE